MSLDEINGKGNSNERKLKLENLDDIPHELSVNDGMAILNGDSNSNGQKGTANNFTKVKKTKKTRKKKGKGMMGIRKMNDDRSKMNSLVASIERTFIGE